MEEKNYNKLIKEILESLEFANAEVQQLREREIRLLTQVLELQKMKISLIKEISELKYPDSV